MATLFRALIVVIGIAVTFASPIVLILTLKNFDAVLFGLATIASTALSLPPYLTGLLGSYWSWNEPDSRRRLKRALIVVIAVQLAGGTALIVIVAVAGQALPIALLEVVVSFALTPALIALGRAAKRRETALVSGDDWVDTTKADIRTGYRNGAIGFAAGAAIAIVGIVLIEVLLGSGRHSFDTELISLGFSFAFIGAALGMMLTTLRVAKHVRALLGSEYGAIRRLARVVVRAKPDQLTEEDEGRAARYASVLSQFLPFQAISFAALYLGIFASQFGLVLNGSSRTSGLQIFSLAIVILAVVVVFPIFVLRIRTVRRYAAAHPVTT